MFDLVKAFVAAYHAALMARLSARGEQALARDPAVGARAPRPLQGLDGKFRLFRYSHWIPAQWRDFHELYEFAPHARLAARAARLRRAGAFAKPGVSLEQEYLKSLLLMRLDSGNFTPDQVEWVGEAARGLDAVAHAGAAARRGCRLRRRPDRRAGLAPARQARTPAAAVLFLDAGPIYARVVERMRWLPEQDEDMPQPGDLPPREQRLLLMRLAALFGPDAIAHAPRAPRHAADGEVRVVVGLQALTRAVAEIDRLPDAARTPGVVGELRRSHAGHESERRTRNRSRARIRGSIWKIVDRSDTGCRFTAPVKDAPTAPGRARRDQGGRSCGCSRSSGGCSASKSTK